MKSLTNSLQPCKGVQPERKSRTFATDFKNNELLNSKNCYKDYEQDCKHC